jgi:hypothetical protein
MGTSSDGGAFALAESANGETDRWKGTTRVAALPIVVGYADPAPSPIVSSYGVVSNHMMVFYGSRSNHYVCGAATVTTTDRGAVTSRGRREHVMTQPAWMRPIDETIIEFLRTEGPESAPFVAARTGTYLRYVERRCGALVDRGVLRRITGQRYALTERAAQPEEGCATDPTERGPVGAD